MEKRNFFTSGWLFLSFAIANLAVGLFAGIFVASAPGHLDEWFPVLCFLIPMSIALGILAIFLPRQKTGVKRVLTISFNGVSMLLYLIALIAIINYWSTPSYVYY